MSSELVCGTNCIEELLKLIFLLQFSVVVLSSYYTESNCVYQSFCSYITQHVLTFILGDIPGFQTIE